ncbi:MAG: hypothetical protein HYV65_02035 [Candidatus Spechtbacteria bacterium]|nr:hypothetical protein [Candidatus Spechtbacteria bacterium]
MISFASLTTFFWPGKKEFITVFDLGTFSIKALLVEIGDGKAVVRAACEEHYGPDGFGDIKDARQKVFAELKRISGITPNHIFVGLSGSSVFGKNFSQFYARENPHSEIDVPELKHLLQNVEQRAYESLRKDFARETGLSEIEVYIINAAAQEVKIDGYRVVNPLNFRGREISFSIFNSYVARQYLKKISDLFTNSNLILDGFVYEPFALHQNFLRKVAPDYNAIFLDVGGSCSTVSVVRKGRIEQVGNVEIGGAAFTKKIARELEVGYWEAEHIKMRYDREDISLAVSRKLMKIFANETETFLRGLEIILHDFSQSSLLPPVLYLTGGGSMFSHVQKMMAKKEWREELSFLQPLRINYIEQSFFPLVSVNSQFSYDARWAQVFSLAQFIATESERKDDVLYKTIKRMVKLIQE